MTADRPAPTTQSRRRESLLVAGLTALLTAAILSLVVLLGGPAAGPARPGVAEVAGGQVALTTVRAEVMNHPEGMPASMMPDPVPAGFVRYSVEVTLTADDDEPLAYSASEIRVATPGEEPVGPVRESLGEGVVPPGASLTTSLVYEIPEGARRATLLVDGRELAFRLPDGAGHHTTTPDESVEAPVVVGGAEVDEDGTDEEP